jgi:hypothetical protein
MVSKIRNILTEKKGISSVIIVLLLVLLSLVAIGVVWAVVMNLIGDSVKQINLSGMLIELDIKSVKINGDISVTVQRKSGEGDLAGIVFLFTDGETEESLTKETNLGIYNTQTFSFTLEKIQNVSRLKEVSVAAVVENAGVKKVGNILDTYKIGSSNIQSTSDTESEEEEEILEETSNCEIDGCAGDWVCENGACIPDVPATCVSDGDCPDFYNCTNSSCSCTATCSNLNYNCGIQIVCGVEVDCGSCAAGQYCNSARCFQDTIINSGFVNEVFPSQAKLYFSSSDLPNRLELPLFGKYINFTDGTCRQITYHGLIQVYGINYVELDEVVSTLETGTSYTIWNKTFCGN